MELRQELKQLIEELQTIRASLLPINKEKETWFRKKEELSKTLISLITQLKTIKVQKDKANISAVELKKQRDAFNNEVKKLASELRSLNAEQKSLAPKLTKDTSRLKQEIDRLELFIETEGLTFDKEKKVTEKIKKLRREYSELKVVDEVASDIHSASSEFREKRAKANELHAKLTETAKASGYSEFFELSKKVNTVRYEQQQAFNKFIELKNKAYPFNIEIKKKLIRIDEIRKALGMVAKENLALQRRKQDEFLQDKAKSIEEKLKSKKKLTTEDLIAYQGGYSK